MFDQDHALIHPFTTKDKQYLVTNLHQNNSDDVFMFPLWSWSHLRRAEHTGSLANCVQFVLLHRGKTIKVCHSILDLWKYQRSYWPPSEIYLFTVRCVSATRRVFFTVNSSSALGLSSDEFLMTHFTSRLS